MLQKYLRKGRALTAIEYIKLDVDSKLQNIDDISHWNIEIFTSNTKSKIDIRAIRCRNKEPAG